MRCYIRGSSLLVQGESVGEKMHTVRFRHHWMRNMGHSIANGTMSPFGDSFS